MVVARPFRRAYTKGILDVGRGLDLGAEVIRDADPETAGFINCLAIEMGIDEIA
jgi:hypothetical protein